MSSKSRTEASIKNVFVSIMWQVTNLILSFVCRFVFVRTLSSDYLGIEGLFTNILTIFSLADLGIGSAIVYALYKPIAEDNIEKIKSLVEYFGKCYRIIALIILIISIVISPFLNFFINGEITISQTELLIIFYLFVVDSFFSYLFVYKAQLLNATQNNYIYNYCQIVGKVLMSVLMVTFLILTKNYVVFLTIKIVFRLLTNIYMTWKTNKLFPYLREKKCESLEKHDKCGIMKNVLGLSLNQVGFVLINGTDNIILSKYINITAVALYSNYLLILNAASNLVGQIFNSIVASVGNLAVSEDESKITEYFEKIHFINFVFASVLSVGLYSCVDDMVAIFFGDNYVMARGTVLILILNFFLLVMKNVVGTFKYACGVYWDDKFCTIIRAVINVIISVFLAVRIGIIGVFIGTLISDLLTTFWFQPYILYKKSMAKSPIFYFRDFFKYFLVFCVECGVISFAKKCIFIDQPIVRLFVFGVLSLCACFMVTILLFYRKDEYQYFVHLVQNRIF